jgi:amino acid transporter
LLHNSLGKAHNSNLTPHTAVMLCSLIIFLIPASLNLFGVKTFEILGYMATICTYGFLLVYILVSIAAPVYLHRLGKLRLIDIVFAALGVAFMMLPVVGTVGIPGSNLFPVPDAPYNIFPYLFSLYITLGFGIDAIHASFKDGE